MLIGLGLIVLALCGVVWLVIAIKRNKTCDSSWIKVTAKVTKTEYLHTEECVEHFKAYISYVVKGITVTDILYDNDTTIKEGALVKLYVNPNNPDEFEDVTSLFEYMALIVLIILVGSLGIMFLFRG